MDSKLFQKVKEAISAEGYFITITTLKDGRLSHYQKREKFFKEDVLPSLEEIKKLIMREMD